MWLIKYAIFGLVAGAVARMLHPGRDPMNWIWTMLLGVGGAVVGGWIGQQLGFDTTSGMASWAAAIGGSVLLLAGFHLLAARNAAKAGPASSDDYKRAVFDDLSKGPNG